MLGQKVLLFNASNMDAFPVYPYAFVQVPAVARRAGIEVNCKDLLGIPQESWKQTVQALIERHNPAMILITLRNTDSLNAKDYERDASGEGNGSAYFPVERTKELISAIRAVSDLKIAVGGFGFSLLADELMHYLRPDFGVFGGPNAFFAHFEDIEGGNPAEVANLLFFQDGQLMSTPRTFYPPLAGTEYTPRTIKEMNAFYASFPTPGFLGAPVEVMRGCSHSCVFCSEPHVLGSQVQYRDPSAVMRDIEMLVAHDITQVYIVSSELNPEGNEFVLCLADRIHAFNERQPADKRITWFGANYLLHFGFGEYERLYRSGFTGGWFDITALDDENARAMRTPYRNETLLAHLKSHVEIKKRQLGLRRTQEGSDGEATGDVDNANEKDSAINWSMFLGNPATTAETIRNTIRAANREGLSQLFHGCHIISCIRVFDYEKLTDAALAVTYSVTVDLERTRYQQLLPSFAYPPALLHDLGSEKEILAMFTHIAETYLSIKYQETRDWHGFVKSRATAASIASWVAELSEAKGVRLPAHLGQTAVGSAAAVLQELFSEEPQDVEKHSFESPAKQVVDALLSACLEAFPDLFESLGLPSTADDLERMTPYALAVTVFARWCTEQDLVDELLEQTQSVLSKSMQDLLRFCIEALLYRFNVLVRTKYRALFVPVGLTGQERGRRSPGSASDHA